MKEILVKYYEGNLMEFDGKYLRRLDGDLYHLVADEFVQEYYEIVAPLKPSGLWKPWRFFNLIIINFSQSS